MKPKSHVITKVSHVKTLDSHVSGYSSRTTVQHCSSATLELDQKAYALILQTLEEAKSTCSPDVSVRPVRASGLLTKFQDPTTLLGLNIAQLSCPVGARVIEPITSISQDDSSWHVGSSKGCQVSVTRNAARWQIQ